MDGDLNLPKQLKSIFGRYRSDHKSNVVTSPRNSHPTLVFSIPNRKGFYSLQTLPNYSEFEVWQDGKKLGIMNKQTIFQKFGYYKK